MAARNEDYVGPGARGAAALKQQRSRRTELDPLDGASPRRVRASASGGQPGHGGDEPAARDSYAQGSRAGRLNRRSDQAAGLELRVFLTAASPLRCFQASSRRRPASAITFLRSAMARSASAGVAWMSSRYTYPWVSL